MSNDIAESLGFRSNLLDLSINLACSRAAFDDLPMGMMVSREDMCDSDWEENFVLDLTVHFYEGRVQYVLCMKVR